MYVESIPNRNSPPAILLHEARPEDGKTVKRTLANLSRWPAAKIEIFRLLLRDEPLIGIGNLFQTRQTLPRGYMARRGCQSLSTAC